MSRIIGFYYDSGSGLCAQLKSAFPLLEYCDASLSNPSETWEDVRLFLFNHTAARRNGAPPLDEISQIRRFHPGIPVIITTDDGDLHAILVAFRLARIWDYAIVPRETDYLIGRMHDAINLDKARLTRSIAFPIRTRKHNVKNNRWCGVRRVKRYLTSKAIIVVVCLSKKWRPTVVLVSIRFLESLVLKMVCRFAST